jgi:hypothetical protein
MVDETRLTRLQDHVGKLASEIGERNLYQYEHLQAAADYIESCLGSLWIRRFPAGIRGQGTAVLQSGG